MRGKGWVQVVRLRSNETVFIAGILNRHIQLKMLVLCISGGQSVGSHIDLSSLTVKCLFHYIGYAELVAVRLQ